MLDFWCRGQRDTFRINYQGIRPISLTRGSKHLIPIKPLQKASKPIIQKDLSGRRLTKFGKLDFDNDGVPNATDCAPLNPFLQGPEHEQQVETYQSTLDEYGEVTEDAQYSNEYIQQVLMQMQDSIEKGETTTYESLRQTLSDYVGVLSMTVKQALKDTLNQLYEANILDIEVISKQTEANIRKGLSFKKAKFQSPKMRGIKQPTLTYRTPKEKLSPFYQESSVFGPFCVPYRPVGFHQSFLEPSDCAQGSVLFSPYREFKR